MAKIARDPESERNNAPKERIALTLRSPNGTRLGTRYGHNQYFPIGLRGWDVGDAGAVMKVPNIIQWPMLVGVLATNVYRAKTQSLTIDEAFSYKDYVMAPYEEARKHLDPNNHVLNTLLEKQTVSWFGSSELSIRTPSLLGGAMYMVSALLLVGIMVGETWAAVALFAAMILNPIVLDYMSAARGYSLGLGFEFLGVLLMAREMRSPGSKTRGALMCVAIGVAFGLSAASNLTFLIPNAVLAAGFFLLPLLFGRKQDPEQTGLQAGLLVVAAGITLTEMPFDVFQGVGPASFCPGGRRRSPRARTYCSSGPSRIRW